MWFRGKLVRPRMAGMPLVALPVLLATCIGEEAPAPDAPALQLGTSAPDGPPAPADDPPRGAAASEAAAPETTLEAEARFPDALPIAFGQPVAGTVDVPLAMAAYRFQARADDVLRVRAHGSGMQPRIELFDGQGTELVSARVYTPDLSRSVRVERGGPFLVRVGAGGDQTGAYTLVVERPAEPVGVGPLTLGQPVTGSVEVPLQMAVYRFEAREGDVVRLRAHGSGMQPRIELFDGRGEELVSARAYTPEISRDVPLERTGAYFARIGGGGEQTGGYTLVVERLP